MLAVVALAFLIFCAVVILLVLAVIEEAMSEDADR